MSLSPHTVFLQHVFCLWQQCFIYYHELEITNTSGCDISQCVFLMCVQCCTLLSQVSPQCVLFFASFRLKVWSLKSPILAILKTSTPPSRWGRMSLILRVLRGPDQPSLTPWCLWRWWAQEITRGAWTTWRCCSPSPSAPSLSAPLMESSSPAWEEASWWGDPNKDKTHFTELTLCFLVFTLSFCQCEFFGHGDIVAMLFIFLLQIPIKTQI